MPGIARRAAQPSRKGSRNGGAPPWRLPGVAYGHSQPYARTRTVGIGLRGDADVVLVDLLRENFGKEVDGGDVVVGFITDITDFRASGRRRNFQQPSHGGGTGDYRKFVGGSPRVATAIQHRVH